MPSVTVLHVLEAVAHGTGRHLQDLLLTTPGVDHVVAVPEAATSRGESGADPVDAIVETGVRVRRVPMRRNPAHPDLPRTLAAVRRLAVEVRADLVHGHATIGGLVARLARPGGTRTVYTPNGLHPSRAVRTVERLLRHRTDALVAVSPSEAALAAAELGVPEERIQVIPNGIDLASPPPHDRDLRAELGLPADTRLVGWIGRLARQKAPDVLLAAAAGLPTDVHLVLVGGGPWASRVARRREQHPARARLHLLGHVPEAARLLPQFDVLALPSRWEGAPYVPLEAFRAGTPVVVSDVVGSRDVVVDGTSGLVVPTEAPRPLAEALTRLLDDPVLAAAVREGGRAALRERFDRQIMGAATADLYRSLCGLGPSGR